MTHDEIIEMARQAGFIGNVDIAVKELEAFAKLVAAKEREACAKACEYERNDPDDQFKNYEDTHDDGWIDGCNSCIAAIRARAKADGGTEV